MVESGVVASTAFEDLYLEGKFLPAAFTHFLMAEILTPGCLCDNSVGDINSSVTCATNQSGSETFFSSMSHDYGFHYLPWFGAPVSLEIFVVILSEVEYF